MKDDAALNTDAARERDRSRFGEGVAVEGTAERGGAAGLCRTRGFNEARHSLANASLNVTCNFKMLRFTIMKTTTLMAKLSAKLHYKLIDACYIVFIHPNCDS
jgi:hypothetical protein